MRTPESQAKHGQAALIGALIERIGGITEFSLRLGTSIQAPVNWRWRGRVPLSWCRKVADKFDVPIYGLNYARLCDILDDVPSWKDTVKLYKFPKQLEDKILTLEAP